MSLPNWLLTFFLKKDTFLKTWKSLRVSSRKFSTTTANPKIVENLAYEAKNHGNLRRFTFFCLFPLFFLLPIFHFLFFSFFFFSVFHVCFAFSFFYLIHSLFFSFFFSFFIFLSFFSFSFSFSLPLPFPECSQSVSPRPQLLHDFFLRFFKRKKSCLGERSRLGLFLPL